MLSPEHLLVPIKVQALVIDDAVIARGGALQKKEGYVTNDGRWSPALQDYRLLTNSLGTPGPGPFYGARREYAGARTEHLVLPAGSGALPKDEDRGIYLHWVLPDGLRHAYKPGSLDFPALPDQWLLVRFCRRGDDLQTKAWFLDSGLLVDSDEPANLLIAGPREYEARRAGKVVSLDQYRAGEFQGPRTTITALGNAQTGSPTFTASVSENRNILSWRDDLSDLRNSTPDKKIPTEAALSYLVLGWYRDEQNEPLHDIKRIIDGQTVMEALGWQIDAASPPADLQNRRCLFHGMVAHINYWNADNYKGPMLGYPGSPSVAGVLGDAPPSFKIGVGNNAEDALVSLVASEYSGAKEAPNLWKALEAVIYRQPQSLIGSWNAAPRDNAVHQDWFSSIEAGKVWTIRPRSDRPGMFPADPAVAAKQTSAAPSSENLAALKQLNDAQSAADAASRELAALQQDLYAQWWRLAEVARRDPDTPRKSEEAACQALAARITALRSQRDGLMAALRSLPQRLKSALSTDLELRLDPAPRFWMAADPVIIVKNCGCPSKHEFPRPLPCRLPEETVVTAEVEVRGLSKSFSTAASVTPITAALKTDFAAQAKALTRLLEESSIVEQAIGDLVSRTLAEEQQLSSAQQWRAWNIRLLESLTADTKSQPRDQIRFKGVGSRVPPHRVVELWGQQPWSPLFLDWQITWRPTARSGDDFGPVWRLGEVDYTPADRQSLPQTGGVTVRGRTLLSPIDGRIFKEPIDTLRDLLKPDGSEGNANPAFPAAVREILSRYEIVWDKTLKELAAAGMMGQSLGGLHQTLLRRDITLPRVMPDPARPWADPGVKFGDVAAKPLLDPPPKGEPIGELLSPPVAAGTGLPFTLLRTGALLIEELWLVDDFGQWADLIGGTPAGGSAGQVLHPRVRWHDDRFAMAMPPRVVQPTRLNFRFTVADDPALESNGSNSDPALSPICGWICYGPLDQTLVLFDRTGQLAGEIVITPERGHYRINWEPGVEGGTAEEIRDLNLKAFAKALIQPLPGARPRVVELLGLIDRMLEVIRPAAARRDAALFGRPLALVSASLGFELFGKAWRDPREQPSAARPSGTGDPALEALRLRVNLGCSQNREDGLIGYFNSGRYDRIVPAHLPKGINPSAYIADPEKEAIRAGFGAPESLTLLMDPWGSVQAAAGIVPAKTISLAGPDLDQVLVRMEASFRVGPVLLRPGRVALPVPAVDTGRWNFRGPSTAGKPEPVVPIDPGYFGDQPVIAAEGRLLLVTPDE
jgi:hypothetical protein